MLTRQDLLNQQELMQNDLQGILDGIEDDEVISRVCQVIVDRMSILEHCRLRRPPNDTDVAVKVSLSAIVNVNLGDWWEDKTCYKVLSSELWELLATAQEREGDTALAPLIDNAEIIAIDPSIKSEEG